MNSFLITFKPASENSERGWPIENLRRLVKLCQTHGSVEEQWRFANRKSFSVGDRVFLLLQGKKGPAVIGYGFTADEPRQNAGKWSALIHFETIVDPTVSVLADREDLLNLDVERTWLRAQASGTLLPGNVAAGLELLVVGAEPKPINDDSTTNPDWTRDELILALDAYLKYRPNPPRKTSPEIQALSQTLIRLGAKLFPPEQKTDTFRNPNGLYMKLMNFRRFDPNFALIGGKGLNRGAQLEAEVWNEFADDPNRCEQVAAAIRAAIDDTLIGAVWVDSELDDDIVEAPEGRILTKLHVSRERNRKLVASKRRQALKVHGKLACEVCAFDFAACYGDYGNGYIECHHMKPIATLREGQTTHLKDLALLCANCHRVVHRKRKWLSLEELRNLYLKTK